MFLLPLASASSYRLPPPIPPLTPYPSFIRRDAHTPHTPRALPPLPSFLSTTVLSILYLLSSVLLSSLGNSYLQFPSILPFVRLPVDPLLLPLSSYSLYSLTVFANPDICFDFWSTTTGQMLFIHLHDPLILYNPVSTNSPFYFRVVTTSPVDPPLYPQSSSPFIPFASWIFDSLPVLLLSREHWFLCLFPVPVVTELLVSVFSSDPPVPGARESGSVFDSRARRSKKRERTRARGTCGGGGGPVTCDTCEPALSRQMWNYFCLLPSVCPLPARQPARLLARSPACQPASLPATSSHAALALSQPVSVAPGTPTRVGRRRTTLARSRARQPRRRRCPGVVHRTPSVPRPAIPRDSPDRC